MEEFNGIRINKYISMTGFCSRRSADELVSGGRVRVNGKVAVTGTKVMPEDTVTVDGNELSLIDEYKVYALYKPVGYISSLSDEQGEGVGKFIPKRLRLFPVGRLDKESEGLMLLTNDGELMNSILKAAGGHEKEYIVTVDHIITREFIDGMEKGVVITNGATGNKIKTAPCRLKRIDEKNFSIVLIQGLNRQIRRMCGSFGYRVTRLKRTRIMNVRADGLNPGDIREVTGEELSILRGMINRYE